MTAWKHIQEDPDAKDRVKKYAQYFQDNVILRIPEVTKTLISKRRYLRNSFKAAESYAFADKAMRHEISKGPGNKSHGV